MLDLFSGIGGMTLGLERAGMKTIGFCESDPYCRRILQKHWPNTEIHDDVRTLDGRAYRGTADVVCGGFPCQDISNAGKREGIDGARSGLWREFARILGEVRPRIAIVENVSGLAYRGMGDVLGDLAALGFDAEWHCIPAAAVGADHVRERVWIVAHTGRWHSEELRFPQLEWVESESRRFPNGRRAVWKFRNLPSSSETWESEPAVGRVADGIPRRVDRLRALGNAVVPQVVEMLGRAIMANEDGPALNSIAHPPGGIERMASMITGRPIGVDEEQ